MFQLEIASESLIDAPPSVVWEVLCDLREYPAWCPFTTRIEGTLAVGSTLKETVEMTPGAKSRTQIVRVTEVDMERLRIVWTSSFGLEAFVSAERTQSLSPAEGGLRTRYSNGEVMRGLLVPLVRAVHKRNLDEGFAAIAAALKRRAEELHGARSR